MRRYHFLCTLIRRLEREQGSSSINTENHEIDELIKHAIFTLRIHLIELSKLNGLCNKFHAKYTNSMKKVLCVNDDSSYSSNSDSDGESPCSFSQLENVPHEVDTSLELSTKWLNLNSTAFLPFLINGITGAEMLPNACGAQLIEKINKKVTTQHQKSSSSDDKSNAVGTSQTASFSNQSNGKRNSNSMDNLIEDEREITKKRKLQYNAESLL
uniref:MEIS N-terminal domain-containing protein n=1 Tax=Acrobeloides nanus TaxID=290746 RepID=A0A914CD18_9BILA